MTAGRGVLEMVNLHHEALTQWLRSEDVPDGWVSVHKLPAEAAARAGEFFAESMSPFEMAHRAIDEANAALRKLNDTLEEEIRRIALALHDDAGQLMAAAQMRLDDAARSVSPDAQEKLGAVKTLLDDVDDRLRHLSHELHPAMLDHLGLAAALEFLAGNLAERTGLHISVRSTLRARLPQRTATAFYRIVQEALSNVRRHARASSVHIQISGHGSTVRCTVADDGVGFDPYRVSSSGQPGLGLIGIHERITAVGGALRIDSAPGRGTKLQITAPF
jgi:signal transduction histidine kinase